MVVSKDSYPYNQQVIYYCCYYYYTKKTKDINYNTGLYDQQSYAGVG